MGRSSSTQNNVAAVLLIEFIPEFAKCFDGVGAGNYRQLHPPTSITSSIMLGGTGSPCLFKLIR